MAAQHVSIEASGFLSALARHLMLTRHARANAKMTFPAVSWPSAEAEPTWMGTVALCLRGLSRSALRRRAGGRSPGRPGPALITAAREAEAPGVPGDWCAG